MRAPSPRVAIFFLSASCFAAWLLPFVATSPAEDAPSTLAPMRDVPSLSGRLPAIVTSRDPFAPEPTPAARTADGDAPAERGGDEAPARTARVETALAPADAFAFASGGERVPDIGESDLASSVEPADGIELKATIVGRRAVAYVQNGAVLDIVRVGDRLGSRTIVRIDLRGLTFDDGSRLELASGFHPTPAPVAAPPRALTLRDLRRALEGLRAPAAPATAAPAPTGTTLATAAATPGPRPTIDPRGREPDDNPTPDADAPTPYAVPGIDR